MKGGPWWQMALHEGPSIDSGQLRRPRVNVAQACAIAGVSRRTIYYWIVLGKIEYVRTAGGSIRIFSDTLFRKVTDAVR